MATAGELVEHGSLRSLLGKNLSSGKKKLGGKDELDPVRKSLRHLDTINITPCPLQMLETLGMLQK